MRKYEDFREIANLLTEEEDEINIDPFFQDMTNIYHLAKKFPESKIEKFVRSCNKTSFPTKHYLIKESYNILEKGGYFLIEEIVKECNKINRIGRCPSLYLIKNLTGLIQKYKKEDFIEVLNLGREILDTERHSDWGDERYGKFLSYSKRERVDIEDVKKMVGKFKKTKESPPFQEDLNYILELSIKLC
jgi:hypothetical protein